MVIGSSRARPHRPVLHPGGTHIRRRTGALRARGLRREEANHDPRERKRQQWRADHERQPRGRSTLAHRRDDVNCLAALVKRGNHLLPKNMFLSGFQILRHGLPVDPL